MVEPNDPKPPETPDGADDVDHDAGVGFASAESLQGRSATAVPREPEPRPVEPRPSDPPASVAAEPEPEPAPEPARPADPPAPVQPFMHPQAVVETPPGAGYGGFGSRRREAQTEIPGGMGIFAVYTLILFAVPTLGVSALIALLAVTGRPAPEGDLAASHFIYQQRTLWAGAVAALLGAILIAVGLGVFVLFLLAIWLILRGAAGVLKLKAGRAIPNPRAWLI